jgi:hypothetical protein
MTSDANYPEPTGVWLFSQGRLHDGLGCPAGSPQGIEFDKTSRIIVVSCDFEHGVDQTHEVSFDTVSGKCLSDLDVQSGTRSGCNDE